LAMSPSIWKKSANYGNHRSVQGREFTALKFQRRISAAYGKPWIYDG
jgi:hypothetical protein